METLSEKPSFRTALRQNQRCAIIADGFYEWQWQDEKGKKKQKYHIRRFGSGLLTFAGLYETWQHPQTQETIKSYTIITTTANEQMATIHNHGKRMPVILLNNQMDDWLACDMPVEEFLHWQPVLLDCQAL